MPQDTEEGTQEEELDAAGNPVRKDELGNPIEGDVEGGDMATEDDAEGDVA